MLKTDTLFSGQQFIKNMALSVNEHGTHKLRHMK